MINSSLPRVIFVSGTGTGVGKTLVSAILSQALQADYWKPIQAGFENGTDSEWIKDTVSNHQSVIHTELYKLRMAASPHIAAKAENIEIDISRIVKALPKTSNTLIIEGAGGLMVPLNDNEFVIDLVRALKAPVILVSRNELGSINHSLQAAITCRVHNIEVLGWIFNDEYLDYGKEIAKWTNLPLLGSVPAGESPGKDFVTIQAANLRKKLMNTLNAEKKPS